MPAPDEPEERERDWEKREEAFVLIEPGREDGEGLRTQRRRVEAPPCTQADFTRLATP